MSVVQMRSSVFARLTVLPKDSELKMHPARRMGYKMLDWPYGLVGPLGLLVLLLDDDLEIPWMIAFVGGLSRHPGSYRP